MLVNASLFPGTFYVDTIRGLCPKTTFEFAAWIINVLKPSACEGNGITPDLTFTIETTDGLTKLQTFKTGQIPNDASPQWKQYGFFFQTPSGISDIVIRIVNNAPGGCGNDLALDDITFRPCGPQAQATIQGEPVIDVKNICDYNSKSYTLTTTVSAGYSNPAYQWQFSSDNINWSDISGATTTNYMRSPTPIGAYYYRMAVAEAENISTAKCRVYSNVIKFNVEGRPVTTTSSSPACESAVLTLNATGGTDYSWTGPNGFTSAVAQPQISNVPKSAAGKYYVTVTSDAGCTQIDSTSVAIIPKPIISAGNDVGICEGSSTILKGSGTDTYAWSPATGLSATGIANPTASPTDSTVYTLTGKDNTTGCYAVDSMEVFVYRFPAANAGADKTIIEGESTHLTGTVSGTAVSYNWTPFAYISNPTSLGPVVFPPRDTTYTLHATSQVGCGTATDDVFIKVFKKVDVPNAFSPNRDGINDTWQIPALSAYPDASVSVFNRYGQAIFASKGSYTAWDGRYNNSDLPVGTYYYIIDLKYGLPLKKGWVTILR
jgi:gliding motility-associated-like protein